MHRFDNRTYPCFFAIWGLALLTGLAVPVHAADIYVDTTNDLYMGNCIILCSLRDAILISNSNGQDDTIHVPAGHYTLTIPGVGEDAGLTGDLDIESPDMVTIVGEGPGVTIIDGNALDRVFHIDHFGNGTVILEGLTITGGATDFSGGGIFNWDATLIINSCEITGNHVNGTTNPFKGGGISNEEGLLWINDTVISHNSSENQAGGVYSGETATTQFVRCALHDNSASTGGGMYTRGTSYFNNVTFFDNTASGASGVWVEGSSEFLHCTFAQGLASEEAIFARTAGAFVTLKNSIIVGSCNVESGNIDAVSGNVEFGDTCFMEYGNYHSAGGATGLGSMSNFGFNGGGVPTFKLQEGSVSHDYFFTTNYLISEDARMSPRPLGIYGDAGAYETVADEIFSHGFENRYTTGWSSTDQ